MAIVRSIKQHRGLFCGTPIDSVAELAIARRECKLRCTWLWCSVKTRTLFSVYTVSCDERTVRYLTTTMS